VAAIDMKSPSKKTPFPFWELLFLLLCLLGMGYGVVDIIRGLIRDFLRP
jgi:hypothetical protein